MSGIESGAVDRYHLARATTKRMLRDAWAGRSGNLHADKGRVRGRFAFPRLMVYRHPINLCDAEGEKHKLQIAKTAAALLQSVWKPTIDGQLVLVADHFDMTWYLARYPDIVASGVDPLMHYMQYGWLEGRWASPTFDTDWYISNNPDVAASKLNPLFHYALHGSHERRKTSGA